MKRYMCIRRVQVSGVGICKPGRVVELSSEQMAEGHMQGCFRALGPVAPEPDAAAVAEAREREMLEGRLAAIGVKLTKAQRGSVEVMKALLDEALAPHTSDVDDVVSQAVAGVTGPTGPAGEPGIPEGAPETGDGGLEPVEDLALEVGPEKVEPEKVKAAKGKR